MAHLYFLYCYIIKIWDASFVVSQLLVFKTLLEMHAIHFGWQSTKLRNYGNRESPEESTTAGLTWTYS